MARHIDGHGTPNMSIYGYGYCPYLEMPERDMRCGVLVIPYGDHLGDDPVISMYGYRSVPYTVWPCPYMDLAVLISDSGQL